MYTEADEIPNYMAVLPETVEGKKYQVLEMMDKLRLQLDCFWHFHLMMVCPLRKVQSY